jgi:hypothetical protein
MPPLVGYVLAGERAVIITVKMTTTAEGKSSRASNGSKGDASICQLCNFFTSKNGNFVQCGLQTMSLFFFENSQKNGCPMSFSYSMTGGATKKLSDGGIVQEPMHKDVCLVKYDLI